MKNSRFGLGLAALGRPAYMTLGHDEDLPSSRTVQKMKAHALSVMDEAWRLGIRYFDAARSYGRAEEFVAEWLRTRRRAPQIGSKWGYRYVGEWKLRADVHEVKDHSVEALRAQWAETRELLGGAVSLYQIHSSTFETGVLSNRDVLDELARIRDTGVQIGVTVTGVEQPRLIRAALKVKRGGTRLFGAVQATWNLFERSAGEALEEAHDFGVRVIVKEPLANGKLTVRGENIGELRAVAKAHRVTPDVIALAEVLAQPWADVVLLGAATRAQLRSNVRAARLKLRPGERDELKAMTMPPADYWTARKALPWV